MIILFIAIKTLYYVIMCNNLLMIKYMYTSILCISRMGDLYHTQIQKTNFIVCVFPRMIISVIDPVL